uniref:Ig-like domain-containing protein n=1 Tax=Echeneis naucrates TaxID=173247 RepID=A0A665WDM6_ECHNA
MFHLLHTTDGPENVNLTLSPLQENYVQGSNISLTCSAVSRPAASLYWFLNGDLLSDTGPELRLVNLQMSQSGNYSCQAFNNKTLRSRTAQLSAITVLGNVAYYWCFHVPFLTALQTLRCKYLKVSFASNELVNGYKCSHFINPYKMMINIICPTAPISNIEVNASHTDLMEFSSSVRLSCSVSSGSSPSFSWLNGSSEVTAGDRVQLSDGNTTLTIVNVTRYDRGPFRCHVLNPVSGGTSEPVNIFVIFGPEHVNLTRSPSQPYYDEGTDISLICSAVSSPAALIHWFLNGDLLFDTGAELRLIDVQISHSGNYSCQAFNNITMRNLTSLPVALTVLKSHISNVIITPNNTDLVESSSVSLSCSTSGSFPSFLWLNGSSEVKASDRLHFTDEGATLTIISVTRYDQGPFRCHVFNNFSDYTSDPVKLSIVGPENTHLQLSPSQQHYERGSNITVACSAVSRPAALFYWFLNGDLLTDTGPELRLMNLQMSQSGNYSCQAFNNKTLIYEMSPPSVVSVLGKLATKFRLSCSVSSGSSVSFLWLNRSSEVTASDRVQLTDGGSSLTISSVTRYDKGPFRCNVSNGISHGISQSVNLVIQYGPDAVSVVGPKSVRVGDMTMLYCSAASVPSPTFTWLFKMKPTNVHEAVYVIQSSRNADSGTYTCTAENTVTGQNFSECDCSAAVGRAVLVSAGCCLLIVGVLGIMLYCLMRRKR